MANDPNMDSSMANNSRLRWLISLSGTAPSNSLSRSKWASTSSMRRRRSSVLPPGRTAAVLPMSVTAPIRYVITMSLGVKDAVAVTMRRRRSSVLPPGRTAAVLPMSVTAPIRYVITMSLGVKNAVAVTWNEVVTGGTIAVALVAVSGRGASYLRGGMLVLTKSVVVVFRRFLVKKPPPLLSLSSELVESSSHIVLTGALPSGGGRE
jgi:hypothetical protein